MEDVDSYYRIRFRRMLDIHDDQIVSFLSLIEPSVDILYTEFRHDYNENLRHVGHTRTSIRDSCM